MLEPLQQRTARGQTTQAAPCGDKLTTALQLPPNQQQLMLSSNSRSIAWLIHFDPADPEAFLLLLTHILVSHLRIFFNSHQALPR